MNHTFLPKFLTMFVVTAGNLLAPAATTMAHDRSQENSASRIPPPLPIARPDRNSISTVSGNLTSSPSFSALKAGLSALANGDGAQALSYRREITPHTLDFDVLTWAIATSGASGITSDDIASAMLALKNWPGMSDMQKNWERALASEQKDARTVIAAFGHRLPLTTQGVLVLGTALLQLGDKQMARQIIAPWWIRTKLNARDEKLVLDYLSSALTPSDHFDRMRVMLFANRLASAERVAPLAGAVDLYEAFAATVRNDPQAALKINAANARWRNDPTYIYAKIQYLRRNGDYRSAAELMLKTIAKTRILVDPDTWWKERRVLSREMIDLNLPAIAYKLVAENVEGSRHSQVEAQFHAGWYALRFLNNPQRAAIHFAKIPQLSTSPVSRSRGYYWLGRSAEASRQMKKAESYFHQAAHFGTTFYGQLAASRLGRKTLNIPYPKPTTAERQRFNELESVQAIKRLVQLGFTDKARVLFLELGDTLNSPGELALLATMAERGGDHYTSLKIGKNAVMRGLDVGALSHPLGAIPSSANISASGKALAYAIARQESEFNAQALSSAGARGILQLMPATAKSLATKLGLPFSLEKLNDPSYNATLGSYFLGEQLARFNGSYILTLIGYNAGPRRAAQWINRYGDPRGLSIDNVVDWIERIPFAETRNYVMRVMENYEVYKDRLMGTADIKNDLVGGRKG